MGNMPMIPRDSLPLKPSIMVKNRLGFSMLWVLASVQAVAFDSPWGIPQPAHEVQSWTTDGSTLLAMDEKGNIHATDLATGAMEVVLQASPEVPPGTGISYANGLFRTRKGVWVSSDGHRWEMVAEGTTPPFLEAIEQTGDFFFSLGGSSVYSSSDRWNWVEGTIQGEFAPIRETRFSHAGGKYFLLPVELSPLPVELSSCPSLYSEDGNNWEVMTLPQIKGSLLPAFSFPIKTIGPVRFDGQRFQIAVQVRAWEHVYGWNREIIEWIPLDPVILLVSDDGRHWEVGTVLDDYVDPGVWPGDEWRSGDEILAKEGLQGFLSEWSGGLEGFFGLGEVFYALTTRGMVFRKEPARDWSLLQAPAQFRGLVTGEASFRTAEVLVDDRGTIAFRKRSDLKWEIRHLADSGFTDVAHLGGVWLVGTEDGRILHSEDLEVWQTLETGVEGPVEFLRYFGGSWLVQAGDALVSFASLSNGPPTVWPGAKPASITVGWDACYGILTLDGHRDVYATVDGLAWTDQNMARVRQSVGGHIYDLYQYTPVEIVETSEGLTVVIRASRTHVTTFFILGPAPSSAVAEVWTETKSLENWRADFYAKRWTLQLGTQFYASPVIVPPSEAMPGEGLLLADEGGHVSLYPLADPQSPRWVFPDCGSVIATPVVSGNGSVFFGSKDGNFYCLDLKDGGLRWTFSTGQEIASSAALGADREVVFGTDGGEFLALDNTNGERIWSFSAGARIYASPVVDFWNRVFFASADGKVRSRKAATGEPLWEFSTAGAIYATPALSGRTLFVGSFDHTLYALNTDTGELLWSKPMGDYILASPVVDSAGRLAVCLLGGSVRVLEETSGQDLWQVDLAGERLQGTPVWGCDGTLYVPGDTGLVHALRDGREAFLMRTRPQQGIYASPDLVPGSGLLAVTTAGEVECLAPGQVEVARSSGWAHFRGPTGQGNPGRFSVFWNCEIDRHWCWDEGYGFVWDGCYPWVYFQTSGWFWVLGGDSGSLWLYRDGSQYWTAHSLFPWIFDQSEERWTAANELP